MGKASLASSWNSFIAKPWKPKLQLHDKQTHLPERKTLRVHGFTVLHVSHVFTFINPTVMVKHFWLMSYLSCKINPTFYWVTNTINLWGRKTALDDLKLVSGNLSAETRVHPTPITPVNPGLAFLSSPPGCLEYHGENSFPPYVKLSRPPFISLGRTKSWKYPQI